MNISLSLSLILYRTVVPTELSGLLIVWHVNLIHTCYSELQCYFCLHSVCSVWFSVLWALLLLA